MEPADLSLFPCSNEPSGYACSFATGTAASTSDIDFVVYGCRDILRLEEAILEIDTFREIDIFEYGKIGKSYSPSK